MPALDGCLACLGHWRVWIRPLVFVVYGCGVLIFVPLFIAKTVRDGFNRKDQEVLVAGIFALLALPISFWEIFQHILHFTCPRLQKHIIRILWMVPIYALNAWIGLIYPMKAVYLDSARECYEAYVIYNFMMYLLHYLNMEMDLEVSLELKSQVKHIFPMCCLKDWEMGREFVHNCKHGILQYTIVRPLTSFISFICKISGIYGEGQFRGDVAFPYIVLLNNISQFAAMYCLVLFYKASIAELRPMKPLPKFLCIKAVVFFSFFQSVLIDFLVYTRTITPSDITPEEGLGISTRLQNFLICIEMCMAAIAHHYSFSYAPYVRSNAHLSCFKSFLAMLDISDVQRDVQEHLGIVGSSISRRIRGRTMYQQARGVDESTTLVPKTELDSDSYQDRVSLQSYGTGDISTQSIPS